VKDIKWKSENMLVSVSYDKTIKLWDTRSTIPLHTLVGHQDKVLCVDWDGEKIVSGSADTKLKVWQFK
jgi:WD40 repeat protein